jgi:hypothetical protein
MRQKLLRGPDSAGLSMPHSCTLGRLCAALCAGPAPPLCSHSDHFPLWKMVLRLLIVRGTHTHNCHGARLLAKMFFFSADILSVTKFYVEI